MFERFTVAAREVVIQAQRESIQLRHPHIGTEHLLLGLLWNGPDERRAVAEGGNPAPVAYTVLRAAGLAAERVRADVTRLVPGASKPLNRDDAAALQTIGIDLDAVMAKIEESFGPDALEPAVPAEPPRRGFLQWRRFSGHRPFTPRAKKVLELSLREAIAHKDRHLGTEHILLGLLRDGDGVAAKILIESELSLDELRRSTLNAIGRAS